MTLIGAGAAIVAALIGLVPWMLSGGDHDADSGSPPAGTSATPASGTPKAPGPHAGVPATESASPSTSPVDAGRLVRWKGPLRLSDGSFDFDYAPPHHSDIYGAGTMGLAFQEPDKLVWQSQVEAAPWSGGRTPSRDDCRDAITSNPLSADEKRGYRYRVGDEFCSTTYAQKAVVYFKVTGKEGQTTTIRAIAWDAPAS
ncbi:hypothetical protein ACWCP6_30105 [Streptomyces sp. NPDC002004]